MKLPTHPIFRKALLLGFLAVAGILAGEVYQRMSRRTPEDILTELKATQVLTQGMDVNGRSVTATIWRLPDFASAHPLRNAKGKALTVGKLVYVFKDDIGRARGDCTYPSDLPTWDITCDYVVDAGHSRFVSGSSTRSIADLLDSFATAAQASGWESLGPNVWRKGRNTLIAHTAESKSGITQAALIVQKGLE